MARKAVASKTMAELGSATRLMLRVILIMQKRYPHFDSTVRIAEERVSQALLGALQAEFGTEQVTAWLNDMGKDAVE